MAADQKIKLQNGKTVTLRDGWQKIHLKPGGHRPNKDGNMCVMEAINFFTLNEATVNNPTELSMNWTTAPACVSHHLASLMMGANDRADDETRQKLIPLIPKVIGAPFTEKDVKKLNARIAEIRLPQAFGGALVQALRERFGESCPGPNARPKPKRKEAKTN